MHNLKNISFCANFLLEITQPIQAGNALGVTRLDLVH